MTTSLAWLMFPFVMPWHDASPSFTNISAHLHKPAGLYGHVRVKEGHLYTGSQRLRLVGMNMSLGGSLPASQTDSRFIAPRLAKYGINIVRTSLLDLQPSPNGLFKSDMATLDETAMDRFDYFVSQLKKNGIYLHFPLHMGRSYPGLPAVPGQLHTHQGIDIFHGPAIEAQKQFARAFLEHRNTYTGLRYADEPALAIIEINNENSLPLRWRDGSLDALPRVYADDLKNQWNDWLRNKYKGDIALRNAWKATTPDGVELLSTSREKPAPSSWKLVASRGAQARALHTLDDERGEVVNIQILKTGVKDYDVQYSIEPIQLKPGRPYTLELDTRSDAPGQAAVVLVQPVPFSQRYIAPLELTRDWKRYKLTFTPDDGKPETRFSLTRLGGMVRTLQFANVSLKEAEGEGFREGDTLGQIDVPERRKFSAYVRQLQFDWLAFLADTERKYWQAMRHFIRQDTGSQALIVGTQQNYGTYSGLADMDIVDMHGYWDTQENLGNGRYGMRNVSQLGSPGASVIAAVAAHRVAGKPFIVSEYNYRGANTHASEADLLMLSYASLQDWDGVYIFNYANNDKFNVDRIIGDEGFNGHSNRFVSLVPAALAFHRGDVSASKKPVVVTAGFNALLDKARRGSSSPGTYDFGIDLRQAMLGGVGMNPRAGDGVSVSGANSLKSGKVLVSDTGELRWDERQRIFVANTPRTKMLIGATSGEEYDVGGLTLKPGKTRQNWSSITFSAMGDQQGVNAGDYLLTATGASENAGMAFNENRTQYSWGRAPVMIEGVPLTLRLPLPASRVKAWALDPTGNPGRMVPVQEDGGGALIQVDSRYRSPWYKVQIAH
jgi:hypothetical protein